MSARVTVHVRVPVQGHALVRNAEVAGGFDKKHWSLLGVDYRPRSSGNVAPPPLASPDDYH